MLRSSALRSGDRTMTDTTTRADEAAALLLAVRDGRSPLLDGLPPALQPQTEADSYAIQHAVAARLGPIGGWKVGSPAPDSPRFTCAPIPAAAIVTDGATIVGSDRVVEAEIAVRLGRDLPPRDAPYTEADLRGAIASVHPAMEILATRFADPAAAGPLATLADASSNHSLLLGPPIAGWDGIDLAHETVRLLVDGTGVKTGTGNPGGDLLRLLVWLANTGARADGGLRAGQAVTTGSWTGKDPAGPGQTVVAQFGRCGAATLRFAA